MGSEPGRLQRDECPRLGVNRRMRICESMTQTVGEFDLIWLLIVQLNGPLMNGRVRE